METVFIPLSSGAEICAPSSVTSMTNYVLREQGDWFEDEIDFVRRFIQPGMHALDIGANFGLYSSAILESLQGSGGLWCFEPTPDTAKALSQTIVKNGFSSLATLIQKGLSDQSGEASFYVGDSPELNSLSPAEGQNQVKVDIQLSTLDICAEEYQWPAIDFIKLDAEGAEERILEGGAAFFDAQSPLVMFELVHAGQLNEGLVAAFRQRGFDLFRLVPALNVLIPFDETQARDGFWLNLFAVKPDKQALLAEQGLLLQTLNFETVPVALTEQPDSLLSQLYPPNAKEKLSALEQASPSYASALSAYLVSRDASQSTQVRCDHLSYAFAVASQALSSKEGEQKVERLLTYSRICFDVGQRSLGAKILSFIIENYIKPSRKIALSEAFILPSSVFESIEPNDNWGAWLWSSVIDAFVRMCAFSSFFVASDQVLQAINVMTQMGFVQPDMLKRKDLIIERAKLSAGNAV